MDSSVSDRRFSLFCKTLRDNFTSVLFVAALVVLLLIPSQIALGERIVVDEQSHSGDYSNIWDAVDNADYGDTVYVKPGTYEENIDLKDGITLKGDGAEETKITYSGDDSVVDIWGNSDVTVSGFTLDYNGSDDNATLWIDNSSIDVEIRNNVITGATYSGVEVGDNSTDVLIENNVIRNNEQNGIYVQGNSSARIKSNEIYGNKDGIDTKQESDPQVINNTIVSNEQDGIFVRSNSEPVIKNNIVINNDDGIDVTYEDKLDGNPTLAYNNVWGNESKDYEGIDQPSTDISRDPEFVDLEDRDFHLKSSSPCIDAGKDGGDLGAHPYAGSEPANLVVKVKDTSGDDLDAKIYIDGDFEGDTGWDGKLGENISGDAHYEISVRKKGYVDESKTVYLPVGGKKSVTLKLDKKGQKKSPTAKFSISPGNPETGEAVMFDGRGSTVLEGYVDNWHWDFNGDGEVDEKGRIVWNEFKSPGKRAISLTVLDNEGRKASVNRKIRIEKSDNQPKADFLYEPKRPEEGEVVRFDGRDSTASEGYIDNWHWDFNGDDKIDEKGRIVWIEFKSSGNKKVILTVVDDQGRASTAAEQIKVGTFNQTPNAKLEYNPNEPLVNQEIVFNGSVSDDKDGEVTDYYWVFGDGTSSSVENPTHTYTEPGTYEVELTVTDDEGAIDSTTKQVTAQNRKPTASFTYSPKEPTTGQQLTFDGSSSSDPDGTIEDYKWDLTGNGDTDKTGSNVTHTYDEKGTYEVRLTVTDNYGDSASTTKELKVTKEQEQEAEIDEKHALVVGITKYQYEALNNLNFPAEDARAFHDLLIEEGGFNEKNVTLLTNEEVTTYRFDKELRRLATETESDDLAVIYYSGHGVQGEDAKPLDEEDGYDEYYVTHNTNPTDSDTIYETAYRDDIFANRVNNIPSDQVAIFLDSCYAGGATKTVKGYTLEGQKDFPTKNDVFSDFDDLDGTAIFAASKEDQRSFEPHTPELKEKLGHGVFTYYLLKGLRGEADTDNDSTITIQELRNYVSPKVEEFTEENLPTPQTPKVKGAIDVPLVQKDGKLEGKVKYVKESGKEEAAKGEYVVINLGEKDGVEKGDRFEVHHSPAKGVLFEGLQGKLQVVNVIGSHLATCRLVDSEFSVSKGDKVEKVQK